jgi:hypothetical protein
MSPQQQEHQNDRREKNRFIEVPGSPFTMIVDTEVAYFRWCDLKSGLETFTNPLRTESLFDLLLIRKFLFDQKDTWQGGHSRIFNGMFIVRTL